MSSGASSRPAGSPSTMAVSPGPWDSPAVTNRKDIAPTPYKRGCGRQVGGGTAGRNYPKGMYGGHVLDCGFGAHGLNGLIAESWPPKAIDGITPGSLIPHQAGFTPPAPLPSRS